MEVRISMTDVEPMLGYIKDMHTIVAYLYSKPNLTSTEKMMIASHECLISQLEEEPNKGFAEPHLKLLKE